LLLDPSPAAVSIETGAGIGAEAVASAEDAEVIVGVLAAEAVDRVDPAVVPEARVAADASKAETANRTSIN
jgi:streptogramin lyase